MHRRAVQTLAWLVVGTCDVSKQFLSHVGPAIVSEFEACGGGGPEFEIDHQSLSFLACTRGCRPSIISFVFYTSVILKTT
jgi:hypothetical protein